MQRSIAKNTGRKTATEDYRSGTRKVAQHSAAKKHYHLTAKNDIAASSKLGAAELRPLAKNVENVPVTGFSVESTNFAYFCW